MPDTPEMTPTPESSNMEAYGYVAERRQLHVTFKPKPGKPAETYVYDEVTAAEHRGLVNAPSKGGYLERVIKPNRRQFRLGPPR